MSLDLEKGRNLVMDAKRTFFLLLTVGLLLAGCGYNGVFTTTGAPPATTGSAATPTGIADPGPGSPAATSTALTPSGQGVLAQMSAALYHPGQAMVVHILNHTAHTIVFANHQTNCTVVLLQMQTGSLWQSVAVCKLMTVTKLFSLGAGKSLSVTLTPAPSAWSAGPYRIAFRYASASPAGSGTFQTIFSALFRVG